MNVQITPRTPNEKGGYIMMPLKENIPSPSNPAWKHTTCPKCGKECWDRPLPEGFLPDMFDGKICTMCALKMAAGKE